MTPTPSAIPTATATIAPSPSATASPTAMPSSSGRGGLSTKTPSPSPTTTPIPTATATAPSSSDKSTIVFEDVIESSDVSTLSDDVQSFDTSDSAIISREETLKRLKEDGTMMIEFGEIRLPLFGGNVPVWALLNLLLLIASSIIVLISLIRIVAKNNASRTESNASQTTQRTKLFPLLPLLLGVISAVLFFVTQNLSYLMVLVDKWTVFMAIVLAAQIAFVIYIKKSRKQEPY